MKSYARSNHPCTREISPFQAIPGPQIMPLWFKMCQHITRWINSCSPNKIKATTIWKCTRSKRRAQGRTYRIVWASGPLSQVATPQWLYQLTRQRSTHRQLGKTWHGPSLVTEGAAMGLAATVKAHRHMHVPPTTQTRIIQQTREKSFQLDQYSISTTVSVCLNHYTWMAWFVSSAR